MDFKRFDFTFQIDIATGHKTGYGFLFLQNHARTPTSLNSGSRPNWRAPMPSVPAGISGTKALGAEATRFPFRFVSGNAWFGVQVSARKSASPVGHVAPRRTTSVTRRKDDRRSRMRRGECWKA